MYASFVRLLMHAGAFMHFAYGDACLCVSASEFVCVRVSIHKGVCVKLSVWVHVLVHACTRVYDFVPRNVKFLTIHARASVSVHARLCIRM